MGFISGIILFGQEIKKIQSSYRIFTIIQTSFWIRDTFKSSQFLVKKPISYYQVIMHLPHSLKTTCTDCILNPNDKPYATNMNGCFTVFKTSLENSKTTIEIVTGTIIAVMVSILIFDPKNIKYVPKSSYPSFIYSCFINHIWQHKFYSLDCLDNSVQ